MKTKQNKKESTDRGFTLIETLVAITVLTVAVAAPLTLAAQSLMAAYTAREQVTAFHLAQEAIETVRAQRDHNLITIAKGTSVDWLDGLRVYVETDSTEKPFMVDSISDTTNFITCASPCAPLLFNDAMGFYGHEIGTTSRFTRFVRLTEVVGTNGEEVTVRSEVQWRSGTTGNVRSVIIEENIFNWIIGVTTL